MHLSDRQIEGQAIVFQILHGPNLPVQSKNETCSEFEFSGACELVCVTSVSLSRIQWPTP